MFPPLVASVASGYAAKALAAYFTCGVADFAALEQGGRGGGRGGWEAHIANASNSLGRGVEFVQSLPARSKLCTTSSQGFVQEFSGGPM